MGIRDPVDLALDPFSTSYSCSEEIISAVKASLSSLCGLIWSACMKLHRFFSQFTTMYFRNIKDNMRTSYSMPTPCSPSLLSGGPQDG